MGRQPVVETLRSCGASCGRAPLSAWNATRDRPPSGPLGGRFARGDRPTGIARTCPADRATSQCTLRAAAPAGPQEPTQAMEEAVQACGGISGRMTGQLHYTILLTFHANA